MSHAQPASAIGSADSQAEDHAIVQKRSRNVSEMDQAQLQRKRQTDRKAQQALRQRVKMRVASLEEELSSLKDEAERNERQLNDRIASLEAANALLLGALQQLSRSAEEAISRLSHDPPPEQLFSLTSGMYSSKQMPRNSIHMTQISHMLWKNEENLRTTKGRYPSVGTTRLAVRVIE